MQLEFKDECEDKYSEEGQANKIRWQMYKQTEPGKYKSVTGLFKCKDFFNDVVTAIRSEQEISIYKFRAYPDMVNKEDKEGVPCIVSGLINAFESNIEVANKWLVANSFPPLKPERFPGEKEALLYIPWEYFHNTYYISAISLIMRVCNYGNVTLKDDLAEAIGKMGQDDARLTLLLDKKFELGEAKDYIWWYNKEQNYKDKSCEVNYNFTGLTHNCGIMSWKV